MQICFENVKRKMNFWKKRVIMRFQKGMFSEKEIQKRIASVRASWLIEGIPFTFESERNAMDLLTGTYLEKEIIERIIRKYG